jgi:hypothetical protein
MNVLIFSGIFISKDNYACILCDHSRCIDLTEESRDDVNLQKNSVLHLRVDSIVDVI